MFVSEKDLFISRNYLISVNFSNIRFLGPHFCCRGSPFYSKLGPHWVPMNFFRSSFNVGAVGRAYAVRVQKMKSEFHWAILGIHPCSMFTHFIHFRQLSSISLTFIHFHPFHTLSSTLIHFTHFHLV